MASAKRRRVDDVEDGEILVDGRASSLSCRKKYHNSNGGRDENYHRLQNEYFERYRRSRHSRHRSHSTERSSRCRNYQSSYSVERSRSPIRHYDTYRRSNRHRDDNRERSSRYDNDRSSHRHHRRDQNQYDTQSRSEDRSVRTESPSEENEEISVVVKNVPDNDIRSYTESTMENIVTEVDFVDQEEEDPEKFVKAIRERRKALLKKYHTRTELQATSSNSSQKEMSAENTSPSEKEVTVELKQIPDEKSDLLRKTQPSKSEYVTSSSSPYCSPITSSTFALDGDGMAEEEAFILAAADVPEDEDDEETKCKTSEVSSPTAGPTQSPLVTPEEPLTVQTAPLKPAMVGLKDQQLEELRQRVQEEKRRLRQFIIMQREEQDRKLHSTEERLPETSSKQNMSEQIEEVEEEDDDEEDFDMFSAVDRSIKKVSRKIRPVIRAVVDTSVNLAENWDDAEGYYMASIGEELGNGRYRVLADLSGKGVFSTVVKCHDDVTNSAVAVKIIRNNEMMKRAAEKEVDILQRLNRSDREDRRHVVRLYRTFEFRGHMCLVFEWLWGNLRVALKKYGGTGRGLNPQAVYSYAKQLFIGLRHLKKNRILHADLKPDNILVNERFYRAPEIILGCRYDFAIDTWSAACTIYEIATGDVLFPGRSNNDMLKLFMDLKGRIPQKLVKSGQFSDTHFIVKEGIFQWLTQDSFSKVDVIRNIGECRPQRSLEKELLQKCPQCCGSSQKSQALKRKIQDLADLLEKCLTLDPTKRLTPDEALQHPYLRESMISSRD